MGDGAMIVSEAFGVRLRKAATELDYLRKTGTNKAQAYSFVTEAHVKASVKPVLDKYGLVILSVNYEPMGPPTTDNCVLRCTVVIACDGGSAQAVFSGIGAGNNKGKAPMAACAASLKYALTSGFLIPTGDDPEADGSPEDGQENHQAPKPAADAVQKAPKADEVTEATMLARIQTAPNTEALVSLKPSVTAFQARDKEAFDRLCAAFRVKNKELAK
jgi:hypothetical protein